MPRTLTRLLIFVVTFAVIVHRVAGIGGLGDAPAGGDERDYEALAYNLWKG